jgi:HPt (histidine-containing phosphotransfer) domain-containing protein
MEHEMPTFNKAKLLELVNNDEEFLKEIIHDYLEEMSQKIMALNLAFFKKDLNKIQNIANTLIGSSENMTANELRQAARQLEYAAKIGDLILGAYYLNKIENLLDQIKEALIY